MQLAGFILDHIDPILEEWERVARTMEPAAASMSDTALRDHAAVMLRCLAADLASTQSLAESIEKSFGNEPKTLQTTAGEDHGLARLNSEFTIEQLVAEYRALRSSVLRLWAATKHTYSQADFHDVTRFNEGIDQLLAESVIVFARGTRDAMEAEKRRKDQFLAMLAHELRNPLSPISAAATLLKVAKADEKIIHSASNTIARQVAHMATLVDDLLDVSRVTRGAVELKLEAVDLQRVIDDAIEQVTPHIQAKQHTLAAARLPVPVTVHGDKKRLVQVVANLLANAAKYTPHHGHIALNVALAGTQVALTVEDDGIGMSADFVPHVFDLFAQAELSSDRTAGGLGLGLALAKSITELHSGKVTCMSAGLGKGSSFTVWLPIQVAAPGQVERRRAPRAEAQYVAPLKIMVVDDNVDAATMLAMLLQSAGHDVAVAHRAREALDRSKAVSPHVFVLDIGLPDFDGNELARKLRAQPETLGAVLIALTGYGLEKDREQASEAGFDHHLLKPVDTQQLYGILSHIGRNQPK